MNKFETILDLTTNLHLIPPTVSTDVMKRILDWLASGESIDSDYIKRQLSYDSKFIK